MDSRVERCLLQLLADLRGGPTDLGKLVTRVHQRRRSVVAVSANAISRWNRDAPDAWRRVEEWLTKKGVEIIVA